MKTFTKLLKYRKNKKPEKKNPITKTKTIDPIFKEQAVVLTSFDYFNYERSFSNGDQLTYFLISLAISLYTDW